MSATPQRDPADSAKPAGRRFGVAGAFAALTCTLACCLPAVLAAVGAGASAAAGAGHGAHDGARPRGSGGAALEALHRISPVLLIVSIVFVTVALALRRRAAALPALIVGVALYLSVHGQSDPTVMYAGMALGYAAWIALFWWSRPPAGARSCETSV
ncbi:hypothetical protein [Mycobacterium sp. UM_Kg1]|uniref:hypothetical protein n=1 Tax=Mycobacterium sp. UM_Kg1 TaxID=1545691 RepID=UPI000AA1B453|nr:hypothetical protein [Mycobacterium sp. UM_Kg1]